MAIAPAAPITVAMATAPPPMIVGEVCIAADVECPLHVPVVR